MPGTIPFLHLAARHGRLCLVAGLLAGLLLPGLALALRPWLPLPIAALLALTAYRIGPRAALGGLAELRTGLGLVAVYQVALPLGALALFAAAGVAAHPLALAVVLMLAAPPVAGSPNLTILAGQEPAPALRLLVIGTALFPLTVLPVLVLVPGLSGAGVSGMAALRLMAVIGLAAGAGFALRLRGRAPDAGTSLALDGLAAILLAVLVVGLMSALGPALRTAPGGVALWLGVAVAANLGIQVAAALVLPRDAAMPARAIVAGNRNIALFLVALPAGITDPILLFIGCYQVPMYLTPILLSGLYSRRFRRD